MVPLDGKSCLRLLGFPQVRPPSIWNHNLILPPGSSPTWSLGLRASVPLEYLSLTPVFEGLPALYIYVTGWMPFIWPVEPWSNDSRKGMGETMEDIDICFVMMFQELAPSPNVPGKLLS